ncbi:MAG TPA: DUF2262 domain-containing protein [Pirellulales bacterium]|jgi:hypothetical protein|nr:DUF2262 domain-containing protein [Pirellulales bacterium]
MAQGIELLEKIRRWERRLLAALAVAPVVEVVGRVDADGVDGCRDVNRRWNIEFDCDVWRINGGAMRTERLCVRRPVPQQQFGWYRRQAWPQTVICFRARFVDKRRLGCPHALIEAFEASNVSDPELMGYRAEPIDPSHFEDPVFGVFEPELTFEGYRALVNWLGEPTSLYLDATTTKPALRRALASAHELWKHRRAWRTRISRAVLDELLPLKNDGWLIDDEEPLTAKEFLERIAISGIHVEPNGNFEFWFHDGDLFLDHAIVASGSLRNGISDVSIQG